MLAPMKNGKRDLLNRLHDAIMHEAGDGALYCVLVLRPQSTSFDITANMPSDRIHALFADLAEQYEQDFRLARMKPAGNC